MSFYRYRGTLTDTPLPGPGRPRGTLAADALKALEYLGGEASTVDVYRVLSETGTAPPLARRVGDALYRLSVARPPAVVSLGDGAGGNGRPQRWRLVTGGTA